MTKEEPERGRRDKWKERERERDRARVSQCRRLSRTARDLRIAGGVFFFKSYDEEGRTAERGCSGQHMKLSIGLQIDTRSMRTTIGSVYCLRQYLLKSD
jgi:hypothetical protein